jgi:hypothetical protein
MLSDPLRLALGSAASAAGRPADGGPPLGPDEAAPIPGQTSFDEVLRALNPLQHLPVVGTIYRAVTGDEIQPAFRILGGALLGGIGGMMTSAALAGIEQFRPAERLVSAWNGQPDPFLEREGASPTMLAEARAAYAMQGNGLG